MNWLSLIAFACLLIVIVESQDSKSDQEYNKWKQQNKKNYASKSAKTDSAAHKAYKSNKAAIDEHNKNKTSKYKQRVNSQADMTPEEFKKSRTGYKQKEPPKQKPKTNKSKKVKSSNTNDIASKVQPQNLSSHAGKKSFNAKAVRLTAVDYSSMMSPIKDQGQCGSCVPFTITGILEYWSKKNQINQSFSEQHLVDCYNPDQNGCDGANLNDEMAYVVQSGVVESSKNKYTGIDKPCVTIPADYSPSNFIFDYPDGDEKLMEVFLQKYGPIAIIINTSGLQFYGEGVFDELGCKNDYSGAEHAVVLVGYGTDSKLGDYWIIRNSWGTTWGMNGYGRIARNKNNTCGIANFAVIPMP